ALHMCADLGQRTVANCTETREQRQRRGESIVRRPLEPLDLARITAPSDDVQHGCREVDAVDFWLAMGTKLVARVPQSNRPSRRRSRRTARSLVGRVSRDPFEIQAVD